MGSSKQEFEYMGNPFGEDILQQVITIKSEMQNNDIFAKYDFELTNLEPILNIFPFQCTICYEKFGFEDNLERNLVLHFKEYHLESYIKAKCSLSDEDPEKDKPIKHEIFVPEIKCEMLEPVNEVAEAKLFQCDLCDTEFKGKRGLTNHMRSHSNVDIGRFKCSFCGQRFLDTPSLRKHKRIHITTKEISKSPRKKVDFINCTECYGKFANQEYYQKHQEEKLSIICDLCSLCFCTAKLRFLHKINVHNDDNDAEYKQCGHCKEAVKKNLFSGHMRAHSHIRAEVIQGLKCEICDKSFKYKMLYKQHLETHGEAKLGCEICGKMFHIRRNLEKHRQRKHKCTYKCETCGLVLTTNNKLRVHMVTHSGPVEFRCDQCPKVFKQKASLLEHFQGSHSGLKPYKCTECGKEFAVERQYKNHVRRNHTVDGQLQYTCEECGKPMRDKNSLETHLKIHRGIKDYKCPICDRAFSERHNLKDHLRCHANERAYACTFCDRRFNQQRTLYLHLRIHKGVKNHPCTMCDKSFYQNNQLQRHMWIHTGKPDISCRACNMSFISLETRKQHNANFHNAPLVRIPLNDQDPE